MILDSENGSPPCLCAVDDVSYVGATWCVDLSGSISSQIGRIAVVAPGSWPQAPRVVPLGSWHTATDAFNGSALN